MLKYAPWKGFLLWLGNLPIIIYLIVYHGLDRNIAALIHGLFFITAVLWAKKNLDE